MLSSPALAHQPAMEECTGFCPAPLRMLPGMRNATTPECPNCKRLAARVAELEARIGLLEKNSSNSHKPPSSDIVKPKRPKAAKGKRRIGAQPGHPKHQREPFGPEELDATCQYTLQQCPDCGGRLKRAQRRCRVRSPKAGWLVCA